MLELLIISRRQMDHQRIGQSFVIPSASQLTRTVSLVGRSTLVDATGCHHSILVNFCTSFQHLNAMSQVLLFGSGPVAAQVQGWYMEAEQYDFCIDEGTQVALLTSNEWPSIEVGTKIVMRAIIQ
ncbi:hypothetical protein EDB19DRAFT_616326 [Suillus lakei]|nr:hypothetical protein EDB19DRAFT_616326 [Suillus lakei]